jgi:hypothetical protein
VTHRQRHLELAGALVGVGVGDRDGVAVAGREDEARVLVQGLAAGHGVDRRVVDRTHLEGDRVDVLERAAAAGVAQVVGRDGEGVDSVEVEVRRVDEALQRRVDGGKGPGEDHQPGSVPRDDDTRLLAQGECAVADREGDLHVVRSGVVGDADRVAGAAREGQRGILVQDLGAGHRVDRSVVDGKHLQIDRVGVGHRAAGAGIAEVVAGDHQRVVSVEVRVRRVGQALEGSVDVGQGAGQGHRPRPVSDHRAQPGGGAEIEDAVSDRQRHLDLPGAQADVDVEYRDRVAVGAREGEGGVLVQGLCAGDRVDRRVVDGAHQEPKAVDVLERAADARVAHIVGGDGEGVVAVELGRRGIGEAFECRVDRSHRAGGRDRSRPVSRHGEAGLLAQGERALEHLEGDLDRVRTRVVGYRDRVAVGRAEDERRVLVEVLRTGNAVDGGVVDRRDEEADAVDVLERPRSPGVAEIVRGDGEGVGPEEVGVRRVDQALEGGVDGCDAAAEHHAAAAIAGDRAQARGGAELKPAVVHGEGHLELAGAFVHVQIAHGQGVAIGAGEGQRAVLGQDLGGEGHAVDRNVVDGLDHEADAVHVLERAASAGVAEVVAGNDQRVASVEVGVGRVDQALQGRVEEHQGAGEGDRAGAVARHRQTRLLAQGEGAVGDRQVDLERAALRVGVVHRDRVALRRGEGEGAVLVQDLCRRHAVDGRIVHLDHHHRGDRHVAGVGAVVDDDLDASVAVGGVGGVVLVAHLAQEVLVVGDRSVARERQDAGRAGVDAHAAARGQGDAGGRQEDRFGGSVEGVRDRDRRRCEIGAV